MKALCWHGEGDVRIDTVADPEIQDDRDAILKVTSTAICGSDLHLFDGYMAGMQAGDVLGHEFMGEIVELGKGHDRLHKGDRVVVPFTIACGECFFCRKGLYSLCEKSNPNAEMAQQALGHSPSALFGYSHLLGGIPGGQAEYVRVPYADFGAMQVPEALADEQVLFLTDIYPTGYMAAENCGIHGSETVAVWGCGPVGQFAIKSARSLGAERVFAIDRNADRLQMAKQQGEAETINFENENVYQVLMDRTQGRGPDCCIEAVGAEAAPHGGAPNGQNGSSNATNYAYALREAIYCCRKGGVLSIPGVYTGEVTDFPINALMNKGLTVRTGQTHVHRYLEPLLKRIESGEIDPSFLITHRLKLDDAPEAYKTFRDKQDGCIKVMMSP